MKGTQISGRRIHTIIKDIRLPVSEWKRYMDRRIKLSDLEMSPYLSGDRLYGDDFETKEIAEWYEDEQEAFSTLYVRNKDYHYEYHALNRYHGFRHLPRVTFNNVLGIGSARGDEFKPIIDRIKRVQILESSAMYSAQQHIEGVSCNYIKPSLCNDFPFEDSVFDLILSLGALHHVPNVSHVLKESFRCLANGGYMLIREPIFSMGDWRNSRVGLTKRERGISPKLFEKIISSTGFITVYRAPCMFPVFAKLASYLHTDAFNSQFITVLDAIVSRMFMRGAKYHRTRFVDKCAPHSLYFVLVKAIGRCP